MTFKGAECRRLCAELQAMSNSARARLRDWVPADCSPVTRRSFACRGVACASHCRAAASACRPVLGAGAPHEFFHRTRPERPRRTWRSCAISRPATWSTGHAQPASPARGRGGSARSVASGAPPCASSATASGLVLLRAGAVEQRDGEFDAGVDVAGARRRISEACTAVTAGPSATPLPSLYMVASAYCASGFAGVGRAAQKLGGARDVPLHLRAVEVEQRQIVGRRDVAHLGGLLQQRRRLAAILRPATARRNANIASAKIACRSPRSAASETTSGLRRPSATPSRWRKARRSASWRPDRRFRSRGAKPR